MTDDMRISDSGRGLSFRLSADEAAEVARVLREHEATRPDVPVDVLAVLRDVTGREPDRSDVPPPKVDPVAVAPSWEVGPFKVALMLSAQLAGLEFTADDGRVMVAVLTLPELTGLSPVLAVQARRAAESVSTADEVTAACRDAIGRDPFENAG
ncbi:hypothetical protein [Micromonospora cathayae]|uniref:Immunity protein Imm1 n=1 Tax=Micromonospora cathayae TaxID=3028804 RepID=A0ABY7ZQ84_9ACTN|nr:hypothetical protein [Micromonospora sp. HUAS 3]WDZ84233.1 hypothetical protein PVK37_27860 [Micromonospora sp. HUAS 3]